VVTGLSEVRAVIEGVPDPELPMVTIGDLGILRSVELSGGRVVATITPTYSGCPALDAIAADIVTAAEALGLAAEVRTVLAPPWTTDWITPEGRQKLQDNGIAPPGPTVLLTIPSCPQCGSVRVREVSHFGSTACKALWVCGSCGEPFDQVKAL
jgi:ring-1,2-phenylacetyl-CoA epoxidase subunit PaaD